MGSGDKHRRHPEETARVGERSSRRMAAGTELASILRDARATKSRELLRMTVISVAR